MEIVFAIVEGPGDDAGGEQNSSSSTLYSAYSSLLSISLDIQSCANSKENGPLHPNGNSTAHDDAECNAQKGK